MRRHVGGAARNAAGRREMRRLYTALLVLTALNVSSTHNAPSVTQGEFMDHSHHSLAEDLERMLATQASRRQSLRWLFASAAAVPLASCGGGGGSSADTTASSTTSSTGSTGATTTTTGTCSVIPEETGGPYPGDGTNSNGSGIANALTLSGIVRSDIRTSVSPAARRRPASR
jgi:hypothetical protein